MSGKRKDDGMEKNVATDPSGGCLEKKICLRAHDIDNDDDIITLKRMSELNLDANILEKKARKVRPVYKSSRVKIDLDTKKTFTQQEVALMISRLIQTHKQELDDQYNVFQSILDEYMSTHMQQYPSYIN